MIYKWTKYIYLSIVGVIIFHPLRTRPSHHSQRKPGLTCSNEWIKKIHRWIIEGEERKKIQLLYQLKIMGTSGYYSNK